MITIEIPETERRIYMPEDLSECDEQQYADACLLIWRYQNKELPYDDFRVELVYKLLNLKRAGGKLVKSETEDMHSNIYMLSTYLDSFFEKKDNHYTVKQYYINNHSREIQDAFRRWYGPKDAFENVSFGQYLDALQLYSMLEDDLKKDLLYRFMATFYFPKGKKYDPAMVEENARHFRLVHFGRVYGFFLLFASFQKYLFSAKIYYQGQQLDLSILFADDKEPEEKYKSNIPGIGMLGVAHQVAESGVYGPMQKLRKANLWDMLLYLYNVRKRDMDAKEREKRNKETAKRKKL